MPASGQHEVGVGAVLVDPARGRRRRRQRGAASPTPSGLARRRAGAVAPRRRPAWAALPSGCTTRARAHRRWWRHGRRRARPVRGDRRRSRGAATAASTLRRRPRNVVHAPPTRTSRSSSAAGRVPVELQLGGVDLGRVRGLALLRLAGRAGRLAACARAASVPAATRRARRARRPSRAGADGDGARSAYTGTGVEALLDLHDAHAGLVVAGQQGPLDRRRAPPSRQQREVEVDHRQRRRARGA